MALSLWDFRLGVRAPKARGRFWSPVLADSEARRRFLFGTWRSAVAELFANAAGQQLAAGRPSDVLARCWILASADAPLLRSGRNGSAAARPDRNRRPRVRVNFVMVDSPRTRGRRLLPADSIGGAGAQLSGRSYRVTAADRSKPLAAGLLWPVCALAFPAGCAGAEGARPLMDTMLADSESRRCFLFSGLGDRR